VLTRLRVDELVNAWVGDRDTPFQIALIGVFDFGPFERSDGGVDISRVRSELAA
jgi:diacylglycerol O-acyltransferase